MKISFNWLMRYIRADINPQKAADILTNTGLEVEEIEEIQTVPGGLQGLVLGEVKSKKKHPNADKLSITEVDLGQGEQVQIVCGAPNVDAGQKVVVAPVGTTIYPTSGDPFKIKKAKIRGEESHGMICAEDEIGLGTGHDGIMVLDPSAPLGLAAAEYFKVESDFVFEIGLTPNRTDALGHYGVARDLVAALKLNEEAVLKPVFKEVVVEGNTDPIKVMIENPDGCPRYSGLVIKNVSVKDSPSWLQNKLRAIGVSPINNIVDVTNYVMMEYGQPLHAFDRDQIKGDEVIIKYAEEKDKFITLDEEERTLNGTDLMICNAEKPMCMAGVFGGIDSGIKEGTTSVFLESACFDPATIRKTAKSHGLTTDAAFRFERGVDPEGTLMVLSRAAHLIMEVAGGEVSSKILDEYPGKENPEEITVSYYEITDLIGVSIPEQEIKDILINLDFKLKKEDAEQLTVVVPGYRRDVTRRCDVIEEIIRIYGFNSIPVTGKVSFPMESIGASKSEDFKLMISKYLSDLGFNEMITNSLVSSALKTDETYVKIANPLSAELDVLRTQMLDSQLGVLQHNISRKLNNLRLFELGKTYMKQAAKIKETEWLSLCGVGATDPLFWNDAETQFDFFAFKGLLMGIINRLLDIKVDIEQVHDDIYNTAYRLKHNNVDLGLFGNVAESTLRKVDVKDAVVWHGQLNWTALMKLVSKRQKLEIKPYSKFPGVQRDLALLLPEDVQYKVLLDAVNSTKLKFLQHMELFDVYRGKNIESGKKSYAISMTFLNPERTLTDKEVDKEVSKIVSTVNNLGAELRQ